MRVRFLQSVAGANFAYRRKREYDLPVNIALPFIKDGSAVKVEDTPALLRQQPVETAERAAPEQAVTRRGKKRGLVAGMFG
jgi:hypothetical protein